MAEMMMPMKPWKRLSNACWEKAILSSLHLCNSTLGELGCAAFRLSVLSSLCPMSHTVWQLEVDLWCCVPQNLTISPLDLSSIGSCTEGWGTRKNMQVRLWWSMNRFDKTQRRSVYWSHDSETTRFNWSVSINKRQQQHPVDKRTHWSFSRGRFFDSLLLFLKLSKHLQVRAITR